MLLILFRLLSRILEIVCILLYPLVYVVLAANKYLGALSLPGPDSRQGVLIHAASVGEVNAVRPLVKAISDHYPDLGIVITTTTLNGLKTAQSLGFPARLSVLDLPWLRKQQLKSIDPKLILIVETELWPNLLDQAQKQQRSIVFVNARMSAKTHKRYRLLRGLWRGLEKPIRGIMAQSETDAERLRTVFRVPVQTAGNLKFALQLPDLPSDELRRKYGYQTDDFIICLGSSRPGEEELLRHATEQIGNQIPHLKLVIAPRHPERVKEVQSLFPEVQLFSQLSEETGMGGRMLIIDTIGHLNEFYALCDIAIVGGSLIDFGGHNPLEPAYYGKPVLMGPYHSSCQFSVEELLRHQAILITEADKLVDDLLGLYADPVKRADLGARAKECLDANRHSLRNHLEGIRRWLKTP